MSDTKITVKVYEPLFRSFNARIDALSLKRDAFLNGMIARETPYLANDLEGKQNSGAARRHIAGELKRLGTTTANVVVSKTTAEALNRVVEEHNLVRDAFINRLILFLCGNTIVLEVLDLPECVTGSTFENVVQAMPTSPLQIFEAVHADPMYYLRVACEERHHTGLYSMVMPPQLVGFSCHLEDAMVPRTVAYKQAQEDLDALLATLFDRKACAPDSPVAGGE